MDHIAIMRKSWRLLDKIRSGDKRIESRWYLHKYAPWGKIEPGDTIYFKNSGEPVTLMATVEKVLSVENLIPTKVQELLHTYGKEDGIGQKDIPEFYERFKGKKYCLLICLTEVQKIKPFDIDKTGFGSMAAWITVPDIKTLKRY